MKPNSPPSAVNSPAPTGRKATAQGKERSDAALDHSPHNTSSPEGAKEGGGPGKAHPLFGESIPVVLEELNATLAV
jgi:hypothetical protein